MEKTPQGNPAPYPQQQVPYQHGGPPQTMPPYPPQQGFMPQSSVAGAPPPYTPVAPGYQQYYPQVHQQHQNPYAAPTQPQYYRPQAHVVHYGGFDGGARFDGSTSASVPPPPPGIMPNAAQIASVQGGSVTVTQKQQADFFKGSGGGGYTFW